MNTCKNSDSLDCRIEKLLCEMTLEEKAALCGGEGLWHTKAVERLGLDSVMMTDGPHGLRKVMQENGQAVRVPATCFPTASALAASWNPDVLAAAADTIAAEAEAEDVSLVLGPGVNMKRSPLCGRNFEYFSEDPYLAGELASAYIQTMQKRGVGSCVKHFACNNQETRRFTVSANLSERALREIYLPAFELAIKEAKPAAVMEAYNRINGTHAAEAKWLLTDILRGEWGYDGIVVSDWEAVSDRVASLFAGLDLEMPDSLGNGKAEILKAVKEARISEEVLDTAVRRILNFILKYKREKPGAPRNAEKNYEAALCCARECMVLLKNDGMLPLAKGAPLAVIGEAKAIRIQGSGSSKVVGSPKNDALAAIEGKNGAPVTYVSFEDGVAAAVEAAKRCGRALLFLGLPESFEAEGADRKHMHLPDEQIKLFEAVSAAVPDCAVILTCGAPVELPFADSARALLLTYLCGDAAAEALSELVFGEQNPSGKLAETFPATLADTPAFLNFPGDGDECSYAEDIYIGYRYYDKRNLAVRYPFGHGLSYASFAYGDLSVSGATVRFTVKNTGDRDGFETAQVYAGKNAPTLSLPVKALCGFKKLFLRAGEEKTVEIELAERPLTYWSADERRYILPGGEYTVYVGASSADIRLSGKTTLKGDKPKTKPVDRNTLLVDVIRRECYAPIREIFAGAMLSNTDFEKQCAEYGCTEKNPVVRRRMGYALRQTFYFNPQFCEDTLQQTIKACNERLTEAIKEEI